MDSKPFYLSKTMWANALVLLSSILSNFGVVDILPGEQAELVAGGLAFVNILLRLATRSRVTT